MRFDRASARSLSILACTTLTLGCSAVEPVASPPDEVASVAGVRQDTVAPGSGGGQAPTPAPGTPAAPVANFTVTVVVFATGAVAPDSGTLARIPGATIAISRTATSDAETIPVPEEVARLVADANGEAVFRDLPSAYYRVTVTPPAGSGFLPGTASISRPDVAQFHAYVGLARGG